MLGQTKFFPLLFWCCCWIRDPGWIKIRIRDNHPGSATLQKINEKEVFNLELHVPQLTEFTLTGMW
jgi:hypothetical protein